MKSFLCIFLISVVLFSCAREDQKKLNFYKKKYFSVTGKDWDKIYLKNLIVENNVWAKEFLEGNFQIIFSNASGSEFGWYWEYAYTTKRVSASPGIIIGKKPWLDTATTDLLPRKINELDSFSCSFEYSSNATGNFENAINIWITDKNKSRAKDIILQMVCVFGDVGTNRLGTYVGTIQIDKEEMDEYSYRNKDIDYNMVIFYLHTGNLVLHFNIMDYLRYLVSKKYTKSSNYVSSIELVTSPSWGIGESVIKNFNFKIVPCKN